MSVKKAELKIMFPVTVVVMVRPREVELEKDADTLRSSYMLLLGAVKLKPFHATKARKVPVVLMAGSVKLVTNGVTLLRNVPFNPRAVRV